MRFSRWHARALCIQPDMKTGTRIVGGWGGALAVVAALSVGCAPRTEIGEAEASGGAGAGDSSDVGGSSGSAAEVTDAGGAGIVEPQGSGGCFALMTAANSSLPKLGPNNQVFRPARQNMTTVLNYADQVVFDPPNWEIIANFPANDRSDDATIQLPDALSEIGANLGEIHVTREECRGSSAAGHTVRVYAWWKLEGAIGRTPTEGITLGTAEGESFADTTTTAIVGAEGPRPLNTLNPIVLEHTFSSTDDTDAGDLVLKLWLIETFDFPTTLYVDRVEWE
jgi:hypothetical protein